LSYHKTKNKLVQMESTLDITFVPRYTPPTES